MEKQIFISYSSPDQDVAEKVRNLLEDRGIGCWMAPRDVLPGAIYAEEIIKAIKNTQALLLVCSRNIVESIHVRNEVERAFNYRKVIFPFRIENVELGESFEYFLGSSHWMDAWSTPLEESVGRLAESIKTILKSEDAPADDPANDRGDETLAEHPNNIPAQTSQLIGREKDAEAVRRLLMREDVRLVTLTGPGGTGKTRLSLKVAADLVRDFEDGVFLVSLAPIIDPGLVGSAVAQILDVQETAGRPILQNLKTYLRHREMLLLLDNFEQVIAAAPAITELLQGCSRLNVLITSRELLHLNGEHHYPVLPLTSPGKAQSFPNGSDLVSALSQYEAVRLFIERAVAVKPDFKVTNENAPAVAEICNRLDGLPLAIELAVARIQFLTPQAMLSRLKQKLPLLGRGARDLPARQQTLAGTIGWSYDLLAEFEKQMFQTLSVFMGGFTLSAAEYICSVEGEHAQAIDVFEVVGSLVEKNLIKEEDEREEPRFSMLETIKEFAQRQLEESGEEECTRHRHAAYFLAMAIKAEPLLHGVDQLVWLNRLKREMDNMRAALQWGIKGLNADVVMNAAGDLSWFWFRAGLAAEGTRWLDRILAQETGGSDSARIKAFYGAGLLAAVQAKYDTAIRMAEDSLALSEKLGDRHGAARALWVQGTGQFLKGNPEEGVKSLEEALLACRECMDIILIAEVLRVLGWFVSQRGDFCRGEELFEESLELFQEAGDDRGIYTLQMNHALARLAQGDYERSWTLLSRSLRSAQKARESWNVAWILEALATVSVLDKRLPDQAAHLLGAAQKRREDINAPISPSQLEIYDKTVAAIHESLDDEAFETAWQKGRSMSLDQAVEFAINLDSS